MRARRPAKERGMATYGCGHLAPEPDNRMISPVFTDCPDCWASLAALPIPREMEIAERATGRRTIYRIPMQRRLRR